MRKRWVALAGTVMLGACGGGGSSGSGGTVAVAPGTPTPSPPPATPTPTAPTFTYAKFADLTGNQVFATACASQGYVTLPPIAYPATRFGDGLILAYRASDDAYLVTNDGLNVTYGPAERDPNVALPSKSYTRTVNGFAERFSTGVPQAGGSGLEYARGFSLRVQRLGVDTRYSCTFGIPTNAADWPTSGVTSYARTGLNGSVTVVENTTSISTYALLNATMTYVVDWQRKQATITIRLLGNLLSAQGTAAATTDLGTYTATAALETNGFYGSMTSVEPQSQFSFLGGTFYGPQAREAAFAFEIVAVGRNGTQRISALGNGAAIQ